MSADDALSALSIEAARRLVAGKFKTAGIESPDLDARLLIGAALNLDHTGLAVQAARIVTSEESRRIQDFTSRRIAREPIARILGRKEFWGLDLKLSDETLVPRPDTETVVIAALEFLRTRHEADARIRIADIGTGSGAILLAILSECPNAIGVGTDISIGALTTSQFNARNLNLAEQATFLRSDYTTALTGYFDLIVSNPPYIRSSDIKNLEIDVREHDPLIALDGGKDGLDAYRAIAPHATALLSSNGALIVEVGHDQAAHVSQIMRTAGLTVQGPPRVDLAGLDRVITGVKPAF